MFVYRDFELCGRSEAVGVNGMAATSHPAATLAALDVLREGGNAIDAAVCAAAVQAVVEPTQTGIGGDCFALLMRKGDTRPIALNGSGWSPKAASLDWFLERKLTEIAVESPHSVTVPGAVAAWERLIADHAIYALKSSGIRKPKDLEGRQIANPAGGAIPKVFPAYAKVAGIDESKVKWVVASSESLPGLLALGRVDAIGQFTVGEPRLKKDAEGKELVELTYGDAGLDFYSNGIIASENTISTNPDLVQRFVTATIKGLKYALDNPKEAAEIMKKYHRELDADLGAAELVKVRELAVVPNSSLGKIEPKRAQSTIDLVASAFSLKNPVRVEDAFNVKFVK